MVAAGGVRARPPDTFTRDVRLGGVVRRAFEHQQWRAYNPPHVMTEADYERAVLWVPDPTSPAGWIRRKVWADEPKRKKPPMGFGFSPPSRESAPTDDMERKTT